MLELLKNTFIMDFLKSILILIIGIALGVFIGQDRQKLKMQEDVTNLINQQHRIVMKVTDDFYQEKESNLVLFRKLQNENAALHDNLNSCHLSIKRMRLLEQAAKVSTTSNSSRINATTTGVSADSNSRLSCASLQATCIAWAESYHYCRNMTRGLQDIIKGVSQP